MSFLQQIQCSFALTLTRCRDFSLSLSIEIYGLAWSYCCICFYLWYHSFLAVVNCSLWYSCIKNDCNFKWMGENKGDLPNNEYEIKLKNQKLFFIALPKYFWLMVKYNFLLLDFIAPAKLSFHSITDKIHLPIDSEKIYVRKPKSQTRSCFSYIFNLYKVHYDYEYLICFTNISMQFHVSVLVYI